MQTLKTGAALAALLTTVAAPAFGAVLTVTTNADTSSGGLAGTGPGAAGSLRAAILAANANPGADTINFSCGATCVITLTGPLPAIIGDLTIDGGATASTIIDGDSATPGSNYRAFFVDTGTVAIKNLTVRNVRVVGGKGGNGNASGGGGLGAGAGLFVNGMTAAANVTLTAVTFNGCLATGGAGGSYNATNSAAGGGGLAFPGGDGASIGYVAFTGGGGVQGAGGVSTAAGGSFTNGGAGGLGGGGGGTANGGPTPGSASTGYASNSGGQSGSAGGNGGFGGGGGAQYSGSGNGKGGFGGGGGSAGIGGFGGGGGGDAGATVTAGGTLGGGGRYNAGGGGGAAGACIFVNQGALTTNGGTMSTGIITATGGAAGIGFGGNAIAGTGDPAPAYLASSSGSINGSNTTGGNTAALAPAMPTAVPTLGQWAMILLTGLFAVGGFNTLRRRINRA